jgi:fibro-slime domain-containing protein
MSRIAPWNWILGTFVVALASACASVTEHGSGGSGGAGAGAVTPPGSGGTGVVGTGGRRGSFDAGNDTPPPADGGVACTDAGNCDVGCGNGKIDPGLGEVCDDGNDVPGDGCAADCKSTDKDYACPMPGMRCTYLVACGDGRLGGKETCDDGNTTAGDGCSATCLAELGWDCVRPGTPCSPHCGDGRVAGAEQCEAPNVGRGCSAACKVEPGYVCDAPPATPVASQPATCHKSTCGDSKKEGVEACDDGNIIDGDGCSAGCTLEPDCATGSCVSKCGDAVKLAPEACDDGNVRGGDGCAADCKLESGFLCTDAAMMPPAQLNLAATYRDFIAFPTGTGVRHPDYEAFWGDGVSPLLVKTMLDAKGKPVADGRCMAAGTTAVCPYGQQLTNAANFATWYTDVSGVNQTIQGALLLPRTATGAYVFDSAKKGFYPIDGKGWLVAPAKEVVHGAEAGVNDGLNHNFGFSTEIRYFFQYRGGESLVFSGDDDLWIFVNRRLALDVGGLHSPQERTLDVDQSAAALGLTVGGLYEIALFHAERHSGGSNFKLTLTGFAPTTSTCGPQCGDGVVVLPEQCDLGTDMNTGGYNGCTADCKRGPSCGDGMVQMPEESCDDGANITTYSMTGKAGCAPGCVPSGYCGDAKVDGVFGEQCDLGTDMNTYIAGCTDKCLLGARCGDGQIQQERGEECDDANTVGGDGCSHDCKIEFIP